MSGIRVSQPSRAPSLRDRIRQQLADLNMPGALESLDADTQGAESLTI
jgi:replicative DNA helicase